MSQTLAVWLLIALALVGANLPFLTDRVLIFFSYRQSLTKPVWCRFAELLGYYLLVGFMGLAFEASLGNPASRSWEFYAITLSLFMVLGFPGFVYCYLRKR